MKHGVEIVARGLPGERVGGIGEAEVAERAGEEPVEGVHEPGLGRLAVGHRNEEAVQELADEVRPLQSPTCGLWVRLGSSGEIPGSISG